MSKYLGLKWVSEQLGIEPVQAFAVESQLGTRRKTTVYEDVRLETCPAVAEPGATVPVLLIFALKYEAVNLEFLARVFNAVQPALLEDWIRNEPTGAYARRIGFLYEWMTGRRLDVPDVPSGNYIEALEPEKYFVATRSTNVQRWRVRDNMPGTAEFCPLIQRTKAVRRTENYNCPSALRDLEVAFGAEILMRSAAWLTIKESRASFLIEHEEK